LHGAGNAEEIARYANENDTNVGHVLNFLEELALAKHVGGADPVLAREMFEGIVLGLWQALRPWIENRRQLRRRPKIWMHFDALQAEWSRR
jgi:hypothetical protein